MFPLTNCSTISAVPSLHIIFASTSGHTEFVVRTLTEYLQQKQPALALEVQRAEQAKPEDLLRGDVLLLASGSWNTGGIEGQLNPYMYRYLVDQCGAVQLAGKKVLTVALGDDRYRYRANAAVHLGNFIREHGGEHVGHTLKVINEPYGQEATVQAWADEILPLLP